MIVDTKHGQFECTDITRKEKRKRLLEKDAGKKKDYVMTEVELQSELMSYADRFASIMTQAVEDFDAYNIDVESLSFGGLSVRVRGNKGPLCSTEDWNEDGYTDLVCHFEDDSEIGLQVEILQH